MQELTEAAREFCLSRIVTLAFRVALLSYRLEALAGSLQSFYKRFSPI